MSEFQDDKGTRGHVLLLAGANGAGKDTQEARFSRAYQNSTRIVRHITRPPTPEEVDEQDYYFTEPSRFLGMVAAGSFVEHAAYIGVMSGTSYAELNRKLRQARFANLTLNFEDGLALHQKLGGLGISNLCFFISPVPETSLRETEDAYLAALRRRLLNRGRPSDLIEGRLAKAALHRKLYLANDAEVVYIDNSDGRAEAATHDIARAAFSLDRLASGGPA